MSPYYDVPTYVILWYSIGWEKEFFILSNMKTANRHYTRDAALKEAERYDIDIPCSHGGPYFQIIMIPPHVSQRRYLKKFGAMIVQQRKNVF